ncbi:MAG: hypothetical protein P1U88_04850 [Thalassobaculaceae bacterium]|nr:hypothetical protein [Thalassobaculaceae bacterium]
MTSGKWKSVQTLPSDPYPEEHWVHVVMESEGYHPLTLQLTRAGAAALLSGTEQPDATDPGIAQKLAVGAGSLEALRAFVRTGPANGDAEEIRVTGIAHSRDAQLIAESAEESGGRVAGIGSVVAEDTVPPAPQETGSGEEEPEGDVSDFDLDEDLVIMAIIDDGIGFANERFRLAPDRSRFWYLWDMNARALPSTDGRRGPPTGRDHTKSEIDALLRRHGNDEDRLYRSPSVAMIDTGRESRQAVMFRRSHGTHVLDVAAGYDYRVQEELAEAKRRPIIGVQLASAAIAERSDVFMAPALDLALKEILHRARRLSQAVAKRRGQDPTTAGLLPLVLNFSFGTTAGPHDGSGLMESTIESFLQAYRGPNGDTECEVVLPVGNSHLWRVVAKPTVGENNSVEIPWRVQPDDKTSSYLHIWLPQSPTEQQKISVSVLPPTGMAPPPVQSQVGHHLDWVVGSDVLASVYHRFDTGAGRGPREHIVVAIRPTGTETLGQPTCPHGLWTIRIDAPGLNPGDPIDVRVRRDDSLIRQRPTGRQSYIDHPDYVIFESSNGRRRVSPTQQTSSVTRRGTFNAYCTTLGPVVVGGYRWSDGNMADYSGAGPTHRRIGGTVPDGPDLSAVSEAGSYSRGVLAAGTQTGQNHAQSGTSVAAPSVARALAGEIRTGQRSGTARQRILARVGQSEAGTPTGPQGPFDPIGTDDQQRQRYLGHARVGDGRLLPPEPPVGRPDYRRRFGV